MRSSSPLTSMTTLPGFVPSSSSPAFVRGLRLANPVRTSKKPPRPKQAALRPNDADLLVGSVSDNPGGLNGSTQHSARNQPALKTKAKIARARLDQPEHYAG